MGERILELFVVLLFSLFYWGGLYDEHKARKKYLTEEPGKEGEGT